MLLGREFFGVVLPDIDTKNQGRYKVYIPELQPHMKENTGIWAKNHVHKYRMTRSDKGSYGSYYPLQPGTKVVVKFFTNQIETAYIDRIVSDYEPETLPFKSSDRDEYYQIILTPKKKHLIAICEDTPDKPANSIHIYHNDHHITIVLDPGGLHINVGGVENMKASVNINIQAGVDVNIKAGGNCNIDASTINLNCGVAADAGSAQLISISE